MNTLQRIIGPLVLVGLLTQAPGCTLGPNSPSAARAGDDVVTRTVGEGLFSERRLRTSLIYVETQEGVVHLTGMVEKAPHVEMAKIIAQETPGVVAVREKLFVKD